MTKNLDSRQMRIIRKIMRITDEELLNKIENDLEKISSLNDYDQFFTHTKESVTLEELKLKQNYQPLNSSQFFKEAQEVGIEENINELLSQLD